MDGAALGKIAVNTVAPQGGRKVLLSAMRNEAAFVLEWVAYHKAIGFDRIVVAANPSDDGTDALLKALAKAGEIEFLPHSPAPGVSAQRNAARLFDEGAGARDGDWTIWLDADEFLVVNTGAGRVDDLIARLGDCHGTLINWRIFGDGRNARFTGRFVSGQFARASRRTFFENRLVKTFFKAGPEIAPWQDSLLHRPTLRPGSGLTVASFLAANGKPLVDCERNSDWLQGRAGEGLKRCEKAEWGSRLAQINHYSVRTPEHFLLKRARGRGWVADEAGQANSRHDADFYHKFNRNDVPDANILRMEAATGAELDRLRLIPAVARAEVSALKKVVAKITSLDPGLLEPFAVPASAQPFAPTPDTARAKRRRVTRFGDFRLTFPPEPEAMVRAAYGSARTILEFGSGGSTFLALQSGADFVMSVESDKGWAAKIAKDLGAAHAPEKFRIHHADIGPTGDWGFPTDASGFARYPSYALSVFDQPWFRQPDLVLIDGRFRVACFLAVLLRTTAPVTVLFDDYRDRPYYHWVEEFAAPVDRAGRMVRFDLQPQAVPVDKLTRIMGAFSDAR